MKAPTYHTTLPSQVRFDHKLSALARLLYSEIKALCDQQGYCWASNHYFAVLYQVEKKTVSRWITQLEERHYVRVETGKTTGNQRRIYLVEGPSKREKVSSQKGVGHTISREGYPSKKTSETPPLLINNFIDTNDRINSVSTPKDRDISMDRGRAVGAKKNYQDSNATESPYPPAAAAPGVSRRGAAATLPHDEAVTKPPFSRPSIKEVEAYMNNQQELCASSLTARAQALRFVNYYESNGWKVGRNAMQDWQAAANNWLLNAQTYEQTSQRTRPFNHLHSKSQNRGRPDYSVPL